MVTGAYKQRNTRSFSGAYLDTFEGHRGFGELLTNTSAFGCDDIIFNETVEVELHKRSGDIHSGEGNDDNPGGFGVFKYNLLFKISHFL